MPKKYQPLTKEEKQALLKKHQEYVDKFNVIINQDISRSSLAAQSGDEPVPFLDFDNSLFEKMDNEDEVAVYRLVSRCLSLSTSVFAVKYASRCLSLHKQCGVFR